MKHRIEPFRIKSIEPCRVTRPEQRSQLLARAHYNVALLRASDVMIDLLTDSGASAMSSAQWAALQRGDESYVLSDSYYRFVDAARHVMRFRYVFPTHQGRAAERVLAGALAGEGTLVPGNGHFDTVRANLEAHGLTAVDLVCPEAANFVSAHGFKGNMDVDRLEALLATATSEVPLVILTITNNNECGHPVALENIRRVKGLCQRYDKPLFLDACRFAENAALIQRREPSCASMSILQIVREVFSLADGVVMSAKKDLLANIGGLLALDDPEWAKRAGDQLLVSEGFTTYGGLAGRDLDAIATGFEEAVDEAYLAWRVGMVEELGSRLKSAGVPVAEPFAAHAVFIDAAAMLPHLPAEAHPAQTLNAALYETAGIRACDVGSVKLQRHADHTPPKSLLRLAIPRRVYHRGHMEYIAEACEEVLLHRENWQGLALVEQGNALTHYGARYRPFEPQHLRQPNEAAKSSTQLAAGCEQA